MVHSWLACSFKQSAKPSLLSLNLLLACIPRKALICHRWQPAFTFEVQDRDSTPVYPSRCKCNSFLAHQNSFHWYTWLFCCYSCIYSSRWRNLFPHFSDRNSYESSCLKWGYNLRILASTTTTIHTSTSFSFGSCTAVKS